MRGFITSPKAARVYDFLQRAGPSPFQALGVATGLKPGQLAKALRHLRGGGYASPVRMRGVEFWAVDGASFSLDGQEALSWFAARLEEAGGKYQDGTAVFPKGQEFPVKASDGRVDVGAYFFLLEDLKEKPLRECFRKKDASTAGRGGEA
ncbi:MAG: hypothetical protein ACPLTR_08455 [Thermacetogeniaceae bacterium]